jgi:predicted nucleic acid-binding protein
VVAVDTNVLVLLLAGDEPAQTARARTIFEREAVLLAKTVILETEWVLCRLYRFGSDRIADAFDRAAAYAAPISDTSELLAARNGTKDFVAFGCHLGGYPADGLCS